MRLIAMAHKFAPVGMTVYGRLHHVRRTVEALKRNRHAAESELYIFSDAAKPGDEEKIADVRAYLRTITGFCKVHVIERSENNRFRNNQEGRELLFEEYGRFIFLEEDIVTAPTFLAFMNDALVRFRDDPRVLAINGYTPPIEVPSDYVRQVMLLPRFAAWGFAIWKEWFDEIEMNVTPTMYRDIRSDAQRCPEYCIGGNDILSQLWLQAHGYINALDVRIDYSMFARGRRYVVCPTRSLALTTGCDGSGEHWVKQTDKYEVRLGEYDELSAADMLVQPDERIIAQLKDFYSLDVRGRIVLTAMDAGIYPYWRKFKGWLR